MNGYLLDTTVLIDFLKGQEHAVRLVKKLALQGHELGCCAINVAEVYAGMRPNEEAKTDKLLSSLTYYNIDLSTAKKAGGYRSNFAKRGVTLSIADVMIAAVAVVNNLTLLTANTKDYPMDDLKLEKVP